MNGIILFYSIANMPFITNEQIIDIIEHNNKHKYHGVTDDLIAVSPGATTISVDTNCTYDKNLYVVGNNQVFNRLFFDIYNSIESQFNFSKLDMSNLLIAGGAISQMLIGNALIKDIDIFVYGCDNPEARIFRFLDEISKILESRRDMYSIRKSANTIDINCSTFHSSIQIILRSYSSISEILHGFDLSASSVGYDYSTNKIYFTTIADFTFRSGCMPINLNYRSSTFESRIAKYINRGFRMVYYEPSDHIMKLLHDRNYIISKYIYVNNEYNSNINMHIIQEPIQYRNVADYIQSGHIRYDNSVQMARTKLLNKIKMDVLYSYEQHKFIINVKDTFDLNTHKFCIEVANYIRKFDESIYCYCLMSCRRQREFIQYLEDIIKKNINNYDQIIFNKHNPTTQLTSSFNMEVIEPMEWLYLHQGRKQPPPVQMTMDYQYKCLDAAMQYLKL